MWRDDSIIIVCTKSRASVCPASHEIATCSNNSTIQMLDLNVEYLGTRRSSKIPHCQYCHSIHQDSAEVADVSHRPPAAWHSSAKP
jgi:aspartate carbamoyltransferase regulatory subunit